MLEQFITHMNNCSTDIKFTTEKSTTEIAFRDTLVQLKDNSIITNLYTKHTESHNYLFYDSAHPKLCKDSILYSQFLRIRRICTNKTDFDTCAQSVHTFSTKKLSPPTIAGSSPSGQKEGQKHSPARQG